MRSAPMPAWLMMGWRGRVLLTLRADAEKARVWMREAMNILKRVTVLKRRLRRVTGVQGG